MESKLDKLEIILKELERHGNKSKACRFAGIHVQTLFNWMKKDNNIKQKVQIAISMSQ